MNSDIISYMKLILNETELIIVFWFLCCFTQDPKLNSVIFSHLFVFVLFVFYKVVLKYIMIRIMGSSAVVLQIFFCTHFDSVSGTA